MKIIGILNLTQDSFSDGGLYLEESKALKHSLQMIEDGADIIDIGSQASNINANVISTEIEWKRIFPIIKQIRKHSTAFISIDTYKPKVILNSLQEKVDYINNIRGFHSSKLSEIVQEFKDSKTSFISMYSHSHTEKAKLNSHLTPKNVVSEIDQFFEKEINFFEKVGISHKKVILDTGMGFFLSSDSEVSLTVLRNIDFFVHKYKNIMVSIGKKSFVGKIFGNLSVPDREIPNLLFENFLIQKNVSYIRTHNPKLLSQAKQIHSLLNFQCQKKLSIG